MSPDQLAKLQDILASSTKILVIQADNPDADSLGSALALEQMLSEMGKQVYLYCGINIPDYLHHLSGWDRVLMQLPSQFDASIIVDTSTVNLLSKMQTDANHAQLQRRPCVVLDHHTETDGNVPFATLVINEPDMSSTGELLFELARHYKWPLDVIAGGHIAAAILGDTQGLANERAKATTYRVMADLIDLGVSRTEIEEQRKAFSKLDVRIFKYKAALIERTEFYGDNRLAVITIPQSEINTYSPLYNPKILMQNELLQVKDVLVAVIIKHYDDGRMLCAVRANPLAPIASDVAAHFGGGGHPYAAGFKITDGQPLNEVKSECIRFISEQLSTIIKDTSDEPIQYTF